MTKPLPKGYAWLTQFVADGHPKIITEALKLFGVTEAPGAADSADILGWATEIGLDAIYLHDQTPWCGLFAALVTKRAGWSVVNPSRARPGKFVWVGPPNGPLWAKSWASFGNQGGTSWSDESAASFGDVLVFQRTGGGHVGFYVGEDGDAYHVLGGNEGDAVSIVRIAKARLYAVRRPPYKVAPAQCRKILLAPTGAFSSNEG